MREYLNRPVSTAEVLQNGWLDTGDLGFCFGQELFVTGRAKDVIIVRGQNHAPEELERTLSAVPGVRTGCVAAVSHLPEGAEVEEVWFFVERRAVGPSRGTEELEDRCRQDVLKASGVAADHVVVLEPGTLPRTSSGKVRRAETLRLYLRDELIPPRVVSVALLARSWWRSSWAFLRWRSRRRGGSRVG